MFKSTLLTFSLIGSVSITSFAQTAEQIVAKHIEAIGGAANWKKVNSIKYSGTLSVQGMSIPITQTIVNGKAMRMEFSVMGASNYMIVTNTEGWSYMPVQGQSEVTPMTAEEIKASQDQLSVSGDDLLDNEKNGNKITLAGKDKIDGKDVFKLTVTGKDGETKTMFIDAASYYLVKEQQTVKAQGQEIQAFTKYSNFKKLPEGVVVPMSVESMDGPTAFASVEVNPSIDEGLFKPSK